MNASSLIRSHVLAVTADAFKANGISAPVVSEEEFARMLDRHDWTYRMSDDQRYYLSGLESEQNLERIARSSPVLDMMYRKASSERS